MKLITSKGHEYEVAFVDGPTMLGGLVMLRMEDGRGLPEIAAEFDGLSWLKRESENQGDKEWSGFSVLSSISRTGENMVTIGLAKGRES